MSPSASLLWRVPEARRGVRGSRMQVPFSTSKHTGGERCSSCGRVENFFLPLIYLYIFFTAPLRCPPHFLFPLPMNCRKYSNVLPTRTFIYLFIFSLFGRPTRGVRQCCPSFLLRLSPPFAPLLASSNSFPSSPPPEDPPRSSSALKRLPTKPHAEGGMKGLQREEKSKER